MKKTNIAVIISIDTYLKNFIESGAFNDLEKSYNIHYLGLRGCVDDEAMKLYGVKNFIFIPHGGIKEKILQKFLIITMVKYSSKMKAFKHKTTRVPFRKRIPSYLLSRPVIYHVIKFIIARFIPVWKELSEYLKENNISLVIMPSMFADYWTLNMINTTRKSRVKSLVLINSWDNLVSKGVVPVPSDYVAVWGRQGLKQAADVQNIPRDRVLMLGAPSFEMYYEERKGEDGSEIYKECGIPSDKKILLFAGCAMPFNELESVKKIDDAISRGRYKGFVILYRPHPLRCPRSGEKHFDAYNFKNVYLDKQMKPYYNTKFKEWETATKMKMPGLDYYPKLMKAISAIICPHSTLVLEGAMNKIPSLLICYHDNVNEFMPPSKMAEFDHIQDILNFPGIISCFKEDELLDGVDKLIEYIKDEVIKNKLCEATGYIVFRDNKSYSQRLCEAVDGILSDSNKEKVL